MPQRPRTGRQRRGPRLIGPVWQILPSRYRIPRAMPVEERRTRLAGVGSSRELAPFRSRKPEPEPAMMRHVGARSGEQVTPDRPSWTDGSQRRSEPQVRRDRPSPRRLCGVARFRRCGNEHALRPVHLRRRWPGRFRHRHCAGSSARNRSASRMMTSQSSWWVRWPRLARPIAPTSTPECGRRVWPQK